MSSINSVRKQQVLYFSRKNIEIKNLKNGEKFFIHTTSFLLYSFYKT